MLSPSQHSFFCNIQINFIEGYPDITLLITSNNLSELDIVEAGFYRLSLGIKIMMMMRISATATEY
jgi:hypothetical protein